MCYKEEKYKMTNPEILVFRHCDGKVEDLIEDFTEEGVDIFNPVQPECNVTFAEKKAEIAEKKAKQTRGRRLRRPQWLVGSKQRKGIMASSP